ncbi:TPA: LacI family DNA-binding transcriptional regulator [Klebsiella pneumoniae]|uniref:LacI family DNA-binding transcriptional regulator n=1 Tax=Klebsiella pneumoniae TaxID=573 RepID=UPI0007EB729B|nr:LacI family DNA-binding transcriptional regulator [Klebsiella pneumoniae]HDU5966689.1 LacI family DNA-binding transcriptional regulator [Klebsiella pneumoniae subsp. ozaenae]ANK48286.1 LacI family transcriptional regulator [Klebsiella pneumoniae]EIW8675902.1 LacI family DNA-binding transcriptional regulator [Klebsiella pneumoniae]EIX9543102.1 LacI family DNA-binding transcriptional regulator [Klebsiella pneumoniae]EKW0777455.1 LacI family DNA-binding transcriptional regulator [Klebsiella pn
MGNQSSPEHNGRTITMQDVARAAGVSVSTVSRVLDERLPPSRSPSAEKIREAAKQLGYRRDYVASSLRRGDTGTIGVLVPRLTDTVTAMFYEAVSQAAARQGYFTVVATCGNDPDTEERATQSLLDRRVDGLILSTCRLDDRLPQQLREKQINHVLALRTDGISPSAIGDDELGGYLATRHLLDLGHQEIGIIAGPNFSSSTLNRQKGFLRAMQEAQAEVNPQWWRDSDFTIVAGENAGYEILNSPARPSAIFAVNDDLAIGVMAAAHRLGLEIGRDVSLVGYNDIPLVSRLPIPLTSVKTPLDQLASHAVELLLGHHVENPQRYSLPTLIPRASTRPYR